VEWVTVPRKIGKVPPFKLVAEAGLSVDALIQGLCVVLLVDKFLESLIKVFNAVLYCSCPHYYVRCYFSSAIGEDSFNNPGLLVLPVKI
jgi:hypothetical protein